MAYKNRYVSDPTKFLHVFSCDGGGVLGWATLPQFQDENDKKNALVINYRSLPGGEARNYNGGDTLTHEAGHFFGLFHTFQGDLLGLGFRDGCKPPGDQVDDTPAEREAGRGCDPTSDTCPLVAGRDPIHNFMDYTHDSCMDHFTRGQIDRMHLLTRRFKPQTVRNWATAPPPPPSGPPTTTTTRTTTTKTKLMPSDPCCRAWARCEAEMEEAVAVLAEQLECPCNLEMSKGRWDPRGVNLPSDWSYSHGRSTFLAAGAVDVCPVDHHGAAYCVWITSRTAFAGDFSAHQKCCYDKFLKLITSGAGAGYTSRAGKESAATHCGSEAIPRERCRDAFESYRPPANGRCPDNPTPADPGWPAPPPLLDGALSCAGGGPRSCGGGLSKWWSYDDVITCRKEVFGSKYGDTRTRACHAVLRTFPWDRSASREEAAGHGPDNTAVGRAGPPPPSECCAQWEACEKEAPSLASAAAEIRCPCRLMFGAAGFLEVPTAAVDEPDASSLDLSSLSQCPLHNFGAAYCVRTTPTPAGVHAQCCYDFELKLITSGTGVGTVERLSPAPGLPLTNQQHCKTEVIAKHMCGAGTFGKYRPVPSSAHCPANPTPEVAWSPQVPPLLASQCGLDDEPNFCVGVGVGSLACHSALSEVADQGPRCHARLGTAKRSAAAGIDGSTTTAACVSPGLRLKVNGGPDSVPWFTEMVFQCSSTPFNGRPQYVAGTLAIRVYPDDDSRYVIQDVRAGRRQSSFAFAETPGLPRGISSWSMCEKGSSARRRRACRHRRGDGTAPQYDKVDRVVRQAGVPVGCVKGVEGMCIDTRHRTCHGARVVAGHCVGPEHIKCCPSDASSHSTTDYTDYGDAGDETSPLPAPTLRPTDREQPDYGDAGDETSPLPTPTLGPTAGGPVDYGDAGDETSPLPAPTSRPSNVVARPTAEPSPVPPPGSCLKGQPGICIDVDTRDCFNAKTIKNFCLGPANIMCCPSGVHVPVAAYDEYEYDEVFPTPSPTPAVVTAATTKPIEYDYVEYDEVQPTALPTTTAAAPTPPAAGYGGPGAGYSAPSTPSAAPTRVPSGYAVDAGSYDDAGSYAAPAAPSARPTLSFAVAIGAACLRGQPGRCINTAKRFCVNDDAIIGYCIGPANIRCCPTGLSTPVTLSGGYGYDYDPGEDAGSSPAPGPTVVDDAGYYEAYDFGSERYGGGPEIGAGGRFDDCETAFRGSCINVQIHACLGAAMVTGYCPGAAEIQCCPTGARATKAVAGEASVRDALGACHNHRGMCIDTTSTRCVGESTVAGFCLGADHVRCCPTSAAVWIEERGTVDDDGSVDTDATNGVRTTAPPAAAAPAAEGSEERELPPDPISNAGCAFLPVSVTISFLQDASAIGSLQLAANAATSQQAYLTTEEPEWWAASVAVRPSGYQRPPDVAPTSAKPEVLRPEPPGQADSETVTNSSSAAPGSKSSRDSTLVAAVAVVALTAVLLLAMLAYARLRPSKRHRITFPSGVSHSRASVHVPPSSPMPNSVFAIPAEALADDGSVGVSQDSALHKHISGASATYGDAHTSNATSSA